MPSATTVRFKTLTLIAYLFQALPSGRATRTVRIERAGTDVCAVEDSPILRRNSHAVCLSAQVGRRSAPRAFVDPHGRHREDLFRGLGRGLQHGRQHSEVLESAVAT